MAGQLCKLLKEGIVSTIVCNDVFKNTDASAELDTTFLCFEDVYFGIRKMIIEKSNIPMSEWTIVDIGCAYGFSGFIFKDAKTYIGVDIENGFRIVAKYLKNGYFFMMDGEEFLKEYLPKITDIDYNKTMIICSYNPSYGNSKQCKYITDNFPNYFLEYTFYRDFKFTSNNGMASTFLA